MVEVGWIRNFAIRNFATKSYFRISRKYYIISRNFAKISQTNITKFREKLHKVSRNMSIWWLRSGGHSKIGLLRTRFGHKKKCKKKLCETLQPLFAKFRGISQNSCYEISRKNRLSYPA
jgi:hypothetical protein